jgi:hypothetical protein
MLPTPPHPTKIFGQKILKIKIYLHKIVVHYRHLFGWILTRSETLFLWPKFGQWQHCSCAWIKIAASFPSPDDEKITKGLAHSEERPAPYVIADEKCAIFSNSVLIRPAG